MKNLIVPDHKIVKENDIWYFCFINKNVKIKMFKALSDNDEVPLCYWILNIDGIDKEEFMYLKNIWI